MRFQNLIEKAPLAIGIGRNGRNIYANPNYLEMFGIENLGEFVCRSIAEQWSPESRQIIEEHARRRARGLAAPATYEALGQRRDGSNFSAQIHVTLVNLPRWSGQPGFHYRHHRAEEGGGENQRERRKIPQSLHDRS